MKCNVLVSQMPSLLLTLPGPDQRGHDPGNVITHQEVGGGRPKWRKPCRDECSLSAKPECYHWGQWEHGPWRHNKVGFWWLGHRETKTPSSWYGSIEEFRLMSPVGELGSRVWMHLSAQAPSQEHQRLAHERMKETVVVLKSLWEALYSRCRPASAEAALESPHEHTTAHSSSCHCQQRKWTEPSPPPGEPQGGCLTALACWQAWSLRCRRALRKDSDKVQWKMGDHV